MKILSQKFEDADQAKAFWDNSVYEMLDISYYLAKCGLVNSANEFCDLFANQQTMDVIVGYKFDFELLKKYFGVPAKYVDRSLEPEQIDSESLPTPQNVDTKQLERRFESAIAVLYKEIEIAKG